MEKPRTPRGALFGEDHPNCRVSEEDVRLILLLREEGLSFQAIADKLDTYAPALSWVTIRDIANGRRRGRPGLGKRVATRPGGL